MKRLKLFLLISFCFSVSIAKAIGCNDSSSAIDGDQSPNKLKFEELLRRGQSAPLGDFIVLWFPNGGIEPKNSELKICDTSDCELDTIYSWGPLAKIETLMRTMPDGGKWNGVPNPGHSLVGLFSAIGGFGYGTIPVRMKLIPFKQRNSLQHGSWMRPDMVWGRSDVIYPSGEFWIKDSELVENWSFGTPQHYDEIVRDFMRYKSKELWHGYGGYQKIKKGAEIANRLFMDQTLDGHTFSETTLKNSLLILIKTILNHQGKVFFSQGSCRDVEKAFKTKYPTYINPHAE